MTTVQPYGSAGAGSTPSRPNRALTKALDRLAGSTTYDLAKVEATAEVQAVKSDAVTYVAGRAMHNVTMLSTLETQLAQTCPQASGRLALIADLASFSMAEVVQQTAHRVHAL